MKLHTVLLCGATLAGVATGVLAGEDSTHRWHGVGPAWYEVEGGLQRFAAGTRDEPLPWGDDVSKPEATSEAAKKEATKNELSTAANDQASRTCAGYGFTPGTDTFNRCRNTVDRAIQRQAISAEASVNCTPMGKEMVCQ